MRFASLGSGSEGNALLVECGAGSRPVRLLVDCGFGLRELQRRLQTVALAADALDAILLTHEHGDHVSGVFKLAAASGAVVFATRGTLDAARTLLEAACRKDRPLACVPIDPDVPFEVEGVRLLPMAVPHDAREPVQFIIDDGHRRMASLTDLGHPSPHVVRSLTKLDALVLECNHDPQLLAASDYPPALKRRVAGAWGHLSNQEAAQLLDAIDQSRLHTIVAAHLSRQNNRPELACAALAGVRRDPDVRILVADQDCGVPWVEV